MSALRKNDPRTRAWAHQGAQIAGARHSARASVRKVLAGTEALAGGQLDVLPETERHELIRIMAAFVENAQAS